MAKKTKASYATYRANSTRAKNKARKLAKHLKRHPNDLQASKGTKVAPGKVDKRKHTEGIKVFDASGKLIREVFFIPPAKDKK